MKYPIGIQNFSYFQGEKALFEGLTEVEEGFIRYLLPAVTLAVPCHLCLS